MDANARTAQGFMAWLRNSPVGRQFEAEAAAAAAAQRLEEQRSLIENRTAAQKAADAKGAKLVKAEADAAARFQAARAEFTKAEDQFRAASFARQSLYHELDRTLNASAIRLVEIASPVLHDALQEFRDRRESMRSLRVHNEARGGKTIEGWAAKPFFSSRPSLEGHLKYLVEADATIRSWMLEALTDAEIEARLVALRAGIPDPMVLVEVESLP